MGRFNFLVSDPEHFSGTAISSEADFVKCIMNGDYTNGLISNHDCRETSWSFLQRMYQYSSLFSPVARNFTINISIQDGDSQLLEKVSEDSLRKFLYRNIGGICSIGTKNHFLVENGVLKWSMGIRESYYLVYSPLFPVMLSLLELKDVLTEASIEDANQLVKVLINNERIREGSARALTAYWLFLYNESSTYPRLDSGINSLFHLLTLATGPATVFNVLKLNTRWKEFCDLVGFVPSLSAEMLKKLEV